MAIKIDRRLNLVMPLTRSDDTEIFIHSTPISREVFEQHFLIISKTFAAIYSEGLSYVAGPRIANMVLKKLAVDSGTWDGVAGVRNTLYNEIHRLTNVVLPISTGGWSTVPLYDAIRQELLDADDVSEVENALAFFTCASSMHTRAQLPAILRSTELWGMQTTSLNVTEYANSLPTSIQHESSGETAAGLSVPS